MANDTDDTATVLYLASTSPRRSTLLRQAGINFQVCYSDVDEDAIVGATPADTVRLRSDQKASACASRIKSGIVIGADTTIEFNGESIGKAINYDHARGILRRIRGARCVALTSVTIVRRAAGETIDDLASTCRSPMFMHSYSEEDIEAYLQTGEFEGKAGAFAIQGLGRALVDKIEGSYSNIVGLPIPRTLEMLSIITDNEKFRIADWQDELPAYGSEEQPLL